jgi:tRNA/tmRNA/rRNA uracil-C5-methylase (TrmA/RlmC/RlmD family)
MSGDGGAERRAAPAVGDQIAVEVGPIAHGGHCVARTEGWVIFVRHALPGELVTARITEAGRGFLRADAVTVLRAAPERVAPVCPVAGPGGCGGCDFQHVAPATQRALKARVVAEQLARLAGISDRTVEVEALPGGELGWRTRLRYHTAPDGRLGLRRHRSHEVIPIDSCPIAHPALRHPPGEAPTLGRGGAVEVVWSDDGRISIGGSEPTVRRTAVGRHFTLAAGSFWQVHPAAADVLAAAVVESLAPREGERAWDLYGGAGLFAAALAGPLGPTGRITVVEADAKGAAAARRCLADLPSVRVVRADVAGALANPRWRRVDLVVADPPRSGLGRDVVRGIVARAPRAVCAVSCDPATFARDVGLFAGQGYQLVRIRAFDAFPMTHHVEIVGLLTPQDPPRRSR